MGQREASSARLMQDALAYADGLYNFAYHLSNNAAEAEDLVQETYARALGAAERFIEGSNLRAWLYRILRNTFIDLYRRGQRAPTEGGLDTVVDTRGLVADSGAEPHQERELASRELERAIMTLNEEARVAVLLDMEGFSEAEIADCLGCATGTVKSRLFRARALLRERLGGHGG